MITANRNPDPDGKLQDGALLDEGEFANHQKIGEWRRYKANDELIKSTKHKTK